MADPSPPSHLTRKVWLNTGLTTAEIARVDPSDRGFTLGDGLFETIRVTTETVQHLDQHLARLRAGAAVLVLSIPLGEVELAAACAQVVEVNQVSNGALRLTLTRGPAPRGLALPQEVCPTLLITASVTEPLPQHVAAIVSQSTRRNEHSPLAGIKSLNYLDNVLARREATRRGGDTALLLNTAGNLAEGDAATLFVLVANRWFTPRLGDGALPGTFRARLIEAGLIQEARIELETLLSASALCLGSALGVTKIVSLDGVPCAIDEAATARLEQDGL